MTQSCFRNAHMLLASNSSRAWAPWTFCKIIFHKVWKGWSKLQGDSLASLRRSAERDTRLFDVRLKCAVSPVCVFLTNALWSHNACGLECSGIINARYELTEGCSFKCWCALDCVDCSRMQLCTTPCKGFNVLASQNGFMTRNKSKHKC